MKYRIFLVNFGYYMQDEFNTLKEARDHAKGKSFECTIYFDGKPVYFVGPFSERAL